MGIPNFSSKNLNTPPYICFEGKYINKKKDEEWPALIIITEMFVDIKNIIENIEILISSDYDEIGIITIRNSQKNEKDLNIEEIETIEEDDIKEENINIVIKFNPQNFQLDNECVKIKNVNPGIIIFYIKIIEQKYKLNKDEFIIIKKEKKPKI